MIKFNFSPQKSTPFLLNISAQAAQSKIYKNKAWLLSSRQDGGGTGGQASRNWGTQNVKKWWIPWICSVYLQCTQVLWFYEQLLSKPIGFSVMLRFFFRPHHGRKHNNQSDDEHVDGSVSSKTSVEGASECSVADFLRKEATSNNDFRCFDYFP